MLEAISQALEVLALVLSGIVSFLTSTVRIMLMIPDFLVFILSLVAVMPPFIATFIVGGVTASILFLVLGRN